MVPQLEIEFYINSNLVLAVAYLNLCTEIYSYHVSCKCSLKLTTKVLFVHHFSSVALFLKKKKCNSSITLLFRWDSDVLCLLLLGTNFMILLLLEAQSMDHLQMLTRAALAFKKWRTDWQWGSSLGGTGTVLIKFGLA